MGRNRDRKRQPWDRTNAGTLLKQTKQNNKVNKILGRTVLRKLQHHDNPHTNHNLLQTINYTYLQETKLSHLPLSE